MTCKVLKGVVSQQIPWFLRCNNSRLHPCLCLKLRRSAWVFLVTLPLTGLDSKD
jgi:hypothetical protein